MEEKFLFCVCVTAGDHKVYGPEWKEAEHGKTLIDLFVQACGNKILGQQVQVLVSKDRSFLEAAVVQVCTPLSTLTENCQSYIQFILKAETFKILFDQKSEQMYLQEKEGSKKVDLISSYTQIKPSALTNWKNQFNSTYEPFREKFQPSSPKEVWNEQVAIHNLTTCSSFENMTVQEICDEIRRIKTTEKLQSKPLSPSYKVADHDTEVQVIFAFIDHGTEVQVTCLDQLSESNHDVSKKCKSPLKSGKVTKSAEKIANKNNQTKSPKLNVRTPALPSKSLSPRQPISDRLSLLAQPRRRLFNEKETTQTDIKVRKKSLKLSPREINLVPAFNEPTVASNSEKPLNRKSTVNSTFVREISPQGPQGTTKDYIKKTFANHEESVSKKIVRSLDDANVSKKISPNSLTGLDTDILYCNIHHRSDDKETSQNHMSMFVKDSVTSDVNLIDFNNSPSSKKLFQPKQCTSGIIVEQSNLKRSCSSPSLLESISIKENCLKTPDLLEFVACEDIQSSKNEKEILNSLSSNELKTNMSSGNELVWSNFRGVKFTTSDELNTTFVLDKKKDLADHNISLEEQDLSLATKRRSTTPLPSDYQMSSSTNSAFDRVQSKLQTMNLSSEVDLSFNIKNISNSKVDEVQIPKLKEVAKSPEKTRKHWGMDVEGIDNIVVSSLQAFSNELRATTEIVASNIRSLYEDWRLKNEGECMTDELKSLALKKAPRNPDASDKQVGIVAVFGNLRKIEIKLKTIEQATRAMFQQQEDDKNSSGKIAEKDSNRLKPSISRSKSFKWRELKKNVRNENASQPWSGEKSSDTLNSSSDSDC